jgi:hypothetical protein
MQNIRRLAQVAAKSWNAITCCLRCRGMPPPLSSARRIKCTREMFGVENKMTSLSRRILPDPVRYCWNKSPCGRKRRSRLPVAWVRTWGFCWVILVRSRKPWQPITVMPTATQRLISLDVHLHAEELRKVWAQLRRCFLKNLTVSPDKRMHIKWSLVQVLQLLPICLSCTPTNIWLVCNDKQTALSRWSHYPSWGGGGHTHDRRLARHLT